MAADEFMEIVPVDVGDFSMAARILDSGVMREAMDDIADEFADISDEIVSDIQGGILSMYSKGQFFPEGTPLRQGVADATHFDVKQSGKEVKATIAIDKTPHIRDFIHAPAVLNSDSGWDHPVFGMTGTTVHEIGQPGFFDDPIEHRRSRIDAIATNAIEDIIRAFSRRAS